MAFINNVQCISCVVEYIEEHIFEKIVLDDLSKNSGLSKFHLHRIFKAVTNQSLMEYVRRRKLVDSLYHLLNTNLKIIDISLEYGFNQEQNYIRAFKSAFNICPAQYHKKPFELKITNKLDMNMINQLSTGVVIEPRFILKPQLLVVGSGFYINRADNYANATANKLGSEFYDIHRKQIKNIKNSEIYLALARSNSEEPTEFYMPCTEVNDLKNIPQGMTGSIIPAGTYAVFKYIGAHAFRDITIQTLHDLYSFIFGTWIPTTDYRLALDFHFERMDTTLEK